MNDQPPTSYPPAYPDWQPDPGSPRQEQLNAAAPAFPLYMPPPAQAAYSPLTSYPFYTIPGAPSVQERQGEALAGFILSLLSLFAFISLFFGIRGAPDFFLWLGGLALSITGIVLSARGCRSITRKGLAIAGLVISIVSLVLLVALMTLGIVILFSHRA